jgi:hypothetical protein
MSGNSRNLLASKEPPLRTAATTITATTEERSASNRIHQICLPECPGRPYGTRKVWRQLVREGISAMTHRTVSIRGTPDRIKLSAPRVASFAGEALTAAPPLGSTVPQLLGREISGIFLDGVDEGNSDLRS